ncbi:MAG: hypothetical protein ABIF77_19765 [bacterium]
MKRFILLMLTVVCGLAVTAQAMDADELIAKNIEAMGGLENLQAIETMKTTGKMIVPGMEFPFDTYHMRPSSLRIESDIQGMSFVQAFDGEGGWQINPMAGAMKPQRMTERELKGFRIQADMDGVLVDHEAKGYTVEYLGTTEIEGAEVHQLKLDTGDDIVMDMFFDAEYFIVIKVTTRSTEEGAEFEQDTFLSDYKDVGGVLMAHSMENKMNGQVVNSIMIEAVEVNPELDSSIFAFPEEE